MKSNWKASFSNKLLVISFIVLILSSCKVNTDESMTFSGDQHTIELANKMFESIGGKDAWCKTKSIYIKAEHTEPQMQIPYTSEIWRDLELFDLQIEQQNDSFHVQASLNDKEGIVNYLDKRDTSRVLTKDQLEDWRFSHFNNVYVLLHQMACSPNDYEVSVDEDERLNFYARGEFVTGFVLDDKFRPFQFYAPDSGGNIQGSIFTDWSTDGGLTHSAGGHPLDSSFIYSTEIWIPSQLPLQAAIEQGVFKQ